MVRISLAAAVLGTAATAAAELFMNLTSITGRDQVSVFECWQLDTPFASAGTPGIQGSQVLDLGAVDNATYTVVPPRFGGSFHNAPYKQFVWFISGVTHVTVPDSTDEVILYGGRYGLIFADDTADISERGHLTTFSSSDAVVAFSVPVKDGVTPPHTVLHDGPCTLEESLGI
ncbi:hypothetical protein GGS23DRAFT_552590 [Durotheca rogersii]|uniref:uncharacterized protein n=1 Tax=Durotheca rogersii TaxID=419775 RepID=UPI00221E9444|nr:uncharacterized protein GGS23DRAFT_552590 [Durotheca rogersii]KAI5866889.1 hypothetical protein GGS23DRAFT_552590 [Durotheca rogersii]